MPKLKRKRTSFEKRSQFLTLRCGLQPGDCPLFCPLSVPWSEENASGEYLLGNRYLLAFQWACQSADHWARPFRGGSGGPATDKQFLAFAFASSGRWRKRLIWVMLAFVAAESALLAWRGYTMNSRAWITGVGLVLVLGYSVAGLWQYLKKMEHSRFEDSMVFVYAALLFGYGSFLIIYIFAHYRTGPAAVTYNEADSFLLYYISLLLSACVTCTGLGSYGLRRRRVRRPLVSTYSSSSS